MLKRDGCIKCGIKYSLFIVDDNGDMCVKCHPEAMSNVLSLQENLEKFSKMADKFGGFENLAKIKFIE